MLNRLRALVPDDRARRVAWLVLIFGVLGFYKISLTRHTYWPNVDGGYYTDIAAHVRDGHGLVSSCSILNVGYPSFPHRTSTYPLWPLLVGFVAKLFPILDTAKWMATACYFATLAFAYLWGHALYDKPLLPRLAPQLNAGHVLALMFGVHEFFFQFTSFPYTEGLGFAIAGAALYRSTRLLPRPTWQGGLEMGVWVGLVFLARYQMLLMAMATFPVLVGAAIASSGPRRRYAVMTVAALAGMLLVIGPHYSFIATFTPNLTPKVYLEWQRVRLGNVLSVIPDMKEVHGLVPWILDRLSGFPIAFDPREKTYGYPSRYYAFPYALIISLPLTVSIALRYASREKAREAWAWIRKPESLPWVYAVVLALGCFAMIHAVHFDSPVYSTWYFGGRWGIVCIYAFFLALVLLLAQEERFWKLCGVVILCTSAGIGVWTIRATTLKAETNTPPGPSAFVQWLNDEGARRGGMVVAFRQPQPIAYMTRNVGFHWYYAFTGLDDIRAMVTKLGAAYVIIPGGQSYPFSKSPEFGKLFHLVQTIEGNRIYAPDASLLPTSAG